LASPVIPIPFFKFFENIPIYHLYHSLVKALKKPEDSLVVLAEDEL
jgi:hypothetical protein